MVDDATDLFGKRLQLTNFDGSSTQYLSALTPLTCTDETNHSGHCPIFPSSALTTIFSGSQYPWFENDSPQPVNLVFSPFPVSCTPCAGAIPVYDVEVPSRWRHKPGRRSHSHPLRHLLAYPSIHSHFPVTRVIVRLFCRWIFDYRIGDPPNPLAFAPGDNIATLTTATDDGNAWFRATYAPGSDSATLTSAPRDLASAPISQCSLQLIRLRDQPPVTPTH